MPELPEVEAVRRLLERLLTGRRLTEVEVADDEIVLQGRPHTEVERAILGNTVCSVGRKGKVFWLEFEDGLHLGGHLGMSGWVRECGVGGPRLVSHGNAPLDDASGRPRFLKLRLRTGEGREVAMTDGRRLARLWISSGPKADPIITKIGPDAWLSPPDPGTMYGRFRTKRAPVKSALLDQALFAGVGNWVADEVLYQARIAPHRPCCSLDERETQALLSSLQHVLDLAVEVEADASRYPDDWLFPHRWGGRHGPQSLLGHPIVRESLGGRTTAWLPSLQK